MLALLSWIPLGLALAGGSPLPPPKTGADVVRAMHERYEGKWYKTLTFVQTTTFADGHDETWYETAEIPGKLRIDIAPLDSMRTILFRNDTVHQFVRGKVVASKAFVHPLMVLGFDVYAAPVEETVKKLQDLGVDLSKLREATWQGRPTYVIGADAGDTTSTQFWIDRDRLVFVRLLEQKRDPRKPDGPAELHETQFNRYEKLGKGWISPEVLFFSDGKQQIKESYANMRADVPLEATMFGTDTWTRPAWIR